MTADKIPKSMKILIADDNPDDVELFQLALQECRGTHEVLVASDGVEVLALLRREGEFAGAARPDLVLLDLNMPRKDGREVLAGIKTDDNLKSIPVIVLTSSNAPTDVLTVYRLQANCYIKKPIDFDEFIRVAQLIEDFWFGITVLPDNKSTDAG